MEARGDEGRGANPVVRRETGELSRGRAGEFPTDRPVIREPAKET